MTFPISVKISPPAISSSNLTLKIFCPSLHLRLAWSDIKCHKKPAKEQKMPLFSLFGQPHWSQYLCLHRNTFGGLKSFAPNKKYPLWQYQQFQQNKKNIKLFICFCQRGKYISPRRIVQQLNWILLLCTLPRKLIFSYLRSVLFPGGHQTGKPIHIWLLSNHARCYCRRRRKI